MNSNSIGTFAFVASKRSLLVVLFLGFAFSFPIAAYAQFSDDAPCCDTGWYDVGSYYTPDTGWYDTGSYYTPDTGWYDVGSYYTPDTGWYDVGSYYTPDTGWYDTGSYYTPDTGWYDTGSYYTPSYSYPTYTPSYSTPINFSFSAPSYHSSQPSGGGQQQQQQQQQQSQAINIVNNNVNTNTNTNTNTASVVSVVSGPVTYPVQYVYQPPTYVPPTYTQAPSCTISLSGNVLTWYSSYATSAYITPNIGSVALSGSMTVYSGYGTVYTMGVSGQGGSNTCRTTYNYPTYVPPAPSITLSQIPYTGFDFGPVGNSIYWFSLLSFAVAAGYLLVYYRGGALALAASLVAKRNPGMAEAIEAPAQAVTKAIAPIAQRIERATQSFASMANLPIGIPHKTTNDSMSIVRSNEGKAPRIVITRN